jgi:hypothetical protein
MNKALRFLAIVGWMAGSAWAQTAAKPAATEGAWVASWGASQQIPEPQNALPAEDLRNATVRQIFHLSVGGRALRVHLSNAFGPEALHFTSVQFPGDRPPERSAADIRGRR